MVREKTFLISSTRMIRSLNKYKCISNKNEDLLMVFTITYAEVKTSKV